MPPLVTRTWDGVDLVAGVPERLLRDGLLQLRQAAGGGVAVVLRLAGGLDGGLHDVVRGGEVRFAGAEADDRPAGGLQRLRLGINGQGGGFGNGGNALGNAGGRHGGSILRLQPVAECGIRRIYSMLFTGSSGVPAWNVTACRSRHAGYQSRRVDE